MSSPPLASTEAGPASAVGTARSASSCQDRRANPISRSSSSQSSHASLSGEAYNVATILGHTARLARLDLVSFPTVYNASAATFPDSQLVIAPLLTQLIAMVNDLGASVTFLTSQVETLTSPQPGSSATPSPPATSTLEASLKDLSSCVAALSSHLATQVAPPLPQAPPPTAPAVQNKPAQQKKKLATRLSSHTVAAPDFPFLFKGKLYGNPDTYAKRHPDSPQAAIIFASRHPQSEEDKPYFEQYPATSPFHTGPTPALQFLIPSSPKNRPGHRLPGRAVRGRKAPLQHKSLRQARVVSPKDPHRCQLLNVVSLPRVPPQPSRTIRLSSLLPSPTSWPLCLKRPTAPYPSPLVRQSIAMVLLLSQPTHTPHLLLTPYLLMQ